VIIVFIRGRGADASFAHVAAVTFSRLKLNKSEAGTESNRRGKAKGNLSRLGTRADKADSRRRKGQRKMVPLKRKAGPLLLSSPLLLLLLSTLAAHEGRLMNGAN